MNTACVQSQTKISHDERQAAASTLKTGKLLRASTSHGQSSALQFTGSEAMHSSQRRGAGWSEVNKALLKSHVPVVARTLNPTPLKERDTAGDA